ncbi:MAG: efflux RND transporter permease subunit, partial [Bdellovibrio sp.]
MSSVFRFFVDNWRFSFIVTAFIFLAGTLSLVLLKREAFPPVNFARVKISTFYPGASPEEVEDKVTRVIEDELRGIDDIDDVRSLSQSELSEIDIRVDIDIPNPKDTINEIQRAVQRASARLPADLPDDPRVVEVKAREIPILEMAVVGPNPQRLRDLWADQLQKRIEDVSGVASVRKVGYREREYQILLNPELMRERHIGVSEVNQAVANKMKNVPAGYLRGKSDIRLVRVVGRIKDLQELGSIIVRSNDAGEIVRIRDIARVLEGSEEASVLTRFNGEEATLVLTNKKADVDALKTLQKVRTELESFEKILPKELRIEVYNDEGRRIQNRLEIVNFNGLTGLVIVILVLFLFLPGKVGLTSALSLPLCILGTVILMILNGATFNIITMLALIICLGNLVDNSVVISEYYTTLRKKGVAPPDAAVQAAQQFWVPFTASTITIIAAFVPMLLTTGVFGQFIRWIPIVVAAALVVSLVEALTLLPARLQFLTARARATSRQSYFFSKFEKVFMDLVQLALRRRWITVTLLMALIVSGFVVTAVFNRFELFPAEGVEFYVIRFEGPVDQNLQSTDAIAEQLSQKVREKLDPSWVKAVVARSGLQSFGPGDPQAKTGENVGMVQVGIQPSVAQDLNINEVLKALKSIDRPPQLRAFNVEALKGGPPVGKP